MVSNHHFNNAATTVAVCNSTIAREDQMKSRLLDSQKYCRMLCDRFRHAQDENGNNANSDNIEALLLSMTDNESSSNNSGGTSSIVTKEQVTSFFDQQRARLKAAAEKNVATERTLDNLIGSMRLLKNQIQQEDETMRNNSEGQDEAEEKHVVKDYEAIIADLMQQHDAATPRVELYEATAYRQVCESLGESLPNSGGTGAAAAQGGDDNEDDDIQFVPTSLSNAMTLKCPITTMYMENPHKNKVCGHTYGLDAITQLIRNAGRGRGRCKCPVAGCTNSAVTVDQLEKDIETEYAIKRRRRAEEHETQVRASQANDLEDTDDET
jgi:Zinc-finger of the MIZ type in Nse subunit